MEKEEALKQEKNQKNIVSSPPAHRSGTPPGAASDAFAFESEFSRIPEAENNQDSHSKKTFRAMFSHFKLLLWYSLPLRPKA